jgi:hypothetical protein
VTIVGAVSDSTVRWPRRLLVVMSSLNAVFALGGAWGLATGGLGLGPTLEARLPWGSTVVAGAALAVLVALPNVALATVAARGNRHTGLVGIVVGAAMVLWIAVELAFIRELSFFHPLYVVVGCVMVWAGARAVRIDLGVPAASLPR